MSDNELGQFIRTRREAVTPAEAGLPTGTRRRTPGLRRAELATLAGVSIEYLTRLEQGRDRNPSAPVLAALSDALRLPPAERVHLQRLAKGAEPGFTCRAAFTPARDVRPTVRALLERFEPTPALVTNRLTEVIACTDGYRQLVEPLGLTAEEGWPANLARFVFTDARARSAFPDWGRVADEQVAALKQGPGRTDPNVGALMDELAAACGSEFTDRLERVPGLPRPMGVTRLVHPEAGELRLAYETLELPAVDDQRILVHLPADEATAAALDRLTGRRPGALRAV